MSKLEKFYEDISTNLKKGMRYNKHIVFIKGIFKR